MKSAGEGLIGLGVLMALAGILMPGSGAGEAVLNLKTNLTLFGSGIFIGGMVARGSAHVAVAVTRAAGNNRPLARSVRDAKAEGDAKGDGAEHDVKPRIPAKAMVFDRKREIEANESAIASAGS